MQQGPVLRCIGPCFLYGKHAEGNFSPDPGEFSYNPSRHFPRDSTDTQYAERIQPSCSGISGQHRFLVGRQYERQMAVAGQGLFCNSNMLHSGRGIGGGEYGGLENIWSVSVSLCPEAYNERDEQTDWRLSAHGESLKFSSASAAEPGSMSIPVTMNFPETEDIL